MQTVLNLENYQTWQIFSKIKTNKIKQMVLSQTSLPPFVFVNNETIRNFEILIMQL